MVKGGEDRNLAKVKKKFGLYPENSSKALKIFKQKDHSFGNVKNGLEGSKTLIRICGSNVVRNYKLNLDNASGDSKKWIYSDYLAGRVKKT